MSKLILIKHAAPLVQPGKPPETWGLSEAGRSQCVPLAEAVRPFAPARVVTSVEVKASQTGELIASALGVPCETADGLHEHDRSNVPHLPSREFISLVELFFRKPDELVLGEESAAEALSRFERAVDAVLESNLDDNVAIVSHGTVIALLLENFGDGRGFELWRKMGLPSFVVIDLPEWRVAKIVEKL